MGPRYDPVTPGRGVNLHGPELTHRLVAILAADAAGYSRLMASDERATVTSLDSARAIFKARVEANRGRVVDMAGDSVLAVFDTATGAVSTALEIQDGLRTFTDTLPEDRRMLFRIGIHLGEIFEKPDGTVYGDGVNVAARVQALGDPGGILVSDSVRSAVKGKIAAELRDAGVHSVKNIAEPLKVFEVVSSRSSATPPSLLMGSASPRTPTLHPPLPHKPSIAILPFSNMSADPEQEYFCDGVCEDIITELSRFRSLFVIARNSSFTFEGRAVDVRTVSRELGVRYVVEGSVRRAGRRLRITAQLIDAVTGTHLWAEKYDREVAEIFDIQDELTQRIVVSIAPFIEEAERERVRRHPNDLGAYEIGVRATAKAHQAYRNNDPKILDEAVADASAALQLDPGSVISLGALAFCQWQRLQLGSGIDEVKIWEEGISAATRAIEADRNDALGYVQKAMLLVFAPGANRSEEALLDARRAHELNPHSMGALQILAFVEAMAGHTANALEHLHEVVRLSPREPTRYGICNQFAMTCFLDRRYADGADYAALGIAEAPAHGTLHGWLALNLVGLGNLSKAREALGGAMKFAPAWVERKLADGFLFREEEHRARAASFLRTAAGLNR